MRRHLGAFLTVVFIGAVLLAYFGMAAGLIGIISAQTVVNLCFGSAIVASLAAIAGLSACGPALRQARQLERLGSPAQP